VPELILTPKQGGPTPPKAIAEFAENDAADSPSSNAEEARATKKGDADEQPVQASTDSDKAGLSQEKPAAETADAQTDATPVVNAEPQNDVPATAESAAQ